MLGRFLFAAILGMVLPASGFASDAWGYGLFNHLEHDFGAVQRGGKVSHDFILTNNADRDVHIKSLLVSCGCTQAVAAIETIPVGSSTTIHAVMDTTGFEGPKSVTITVVLNKPHKADVQLRLACISQITFLNLPPELDLGVTPKGTPIEKSFPIESNSNGDLKVMSVEFDNPHLKVVVDEKERSIANVRYELKATLSESAPAGILQDRIRLKTNDPISPTLYIPVRATVRSQVAITPDVLRLGTLVTGQKVTKNIIIKASEPFSLKRVDNTGGIFSVRSSPLRKTTQLVVLELEVPEDQSKITDHLEFVTDLPDPQILSVAIQK